MYSKLNNSKYSFLAVKTYVVEFHDFVMFLDLVEFEVAFRALNFVLTHGDPRKSILMHFFKGQYLHLGVKIFGFFLDYRTQKVCRFHLRQNFRSRDPSSVQNSGSKLVLSTFFTSINTIFIQFCAQNSCLRDKIYPNLVSLSVDTTG